MKLGVLPIGKADRSIMVRIKENLARVFQDIVCVVVEEHFPLLEEAFDEKRQQYQSYVILREVQGYAVRKASVNIVLGVVDADIFVPKLSFVFGEATSSGKAALISLWRLKPEFYGDRADIELLLGRAVKEAIHELGHTLGLWHCSCSSCVMHFSNSISDTDIKQSVFCDKCHLHARISIKT